MGRNRLAELQSKSKYVTPEDVQENGLDQDSNPELIPLNSLDKNMSASTADFFETFEEDVVKNIDKIKTNVEVVKSLQKKILSSVNPEENAASESKLSDLVAENKRLSRKVQNTLKNEKARVEEKLTKQPSPIKKLTSKKKSEDKSQKRKTELRMRQTQIDAQSKRFFDIWSEYNLIQATYRDKSKDLLVRRCKIANNNYDDEQIEKMLEDGKMDVFNECILSQTQMAQQQLTELQDRHDEFIRLEKSIVEVHDMFLEIGNLVSQQGEMVDNILQNVLKAEMDVEKGKDHLHQAKNYAISARKKKMLCAGISVVVLLIIIIVILSEFGAFSSGSSSSTQPQVVERIVEKIVYVTVEPDSSTSTTTTTTTTTLAPDDLNKQQDIDLEFVEKSIPAPP